MFGIYFFRDYIPSRIINTFTMTSLDFTGRDTLIKYGFEGFLNKPLFGHGFMSFSEYAFTTYGLEIGYAHNNYIELLFDMGFVGLVIYYIPYFIFFNYYIHMRKYRTLFLKFLFYCITSILILDVFTMGMKFLIQYLILGISIFYINRKSISNQQNIYANKER